MEIKCLTKETDQILGGEFKDARLAAKHNH